MHAGGHEAVLRKSVKTCANESGCSWEGLRGLRGGRKGLLGRRRVRIGDARELGRVHHGLRMRQQVVRLQWHDARLDGAGPGQGLASRARPTARPALRLALNWERCTGDSQCESKWCGCNGAPLSDGKKCLPSSSYPKTCT